MDIYRTITCYIFAVGDGANDTIVYSRLQQSEAFSNPPLPLTTFSAMVEFLAASGLLESEPALAGRRLKLTEKGETVRKLAESLTAQIESLAKELGLTVAHANAAISFLAINRERQLNPEECVRQMTEIGVQTDRDQTAVLEALLNSGMVVSTGPNILLSPAGVRLTNDFLNRGRHLRESITTGKKKKWFWE